MTAKEKANELVEKYLNTIIHFPHIDTEDGNCIGTGYMTHNSAVRCAINAVDEVLRVIDDYDNFELCHETLLQVINDRFYWTEVKSEIEKL